MKSQDMLETLHAGGNEPKNRNHCITRTNVGKIEEAKTILATSRKFFITQLLVSGDYVNGCCQSLGKKQNIACMQHPGNHSFIAKERSCKAHPPPDSKARRHLHATHFGYRWPAHPGWLPPNHCGNKEPCARLQSMLGCKIYSPFRHT